MKKLTLILLVGLVVFFAGCPATPTENTANTNENADAVTEPAKDLLSELTEAETKANEAWKNKDGKFFEGFLTETFVEVGAGGTTDKAETVKQLAGNPCDIKSFKLSDAKATLLDDNTAVLTSKTEADYTCEGVAGASPTYAGTIFVRNGDTWSAAYHQSIVASDSKSQGPPPTAAAGAKKPAAAADEMTKTLSANETALWDAWAKADEKPFAEHLSDKFINMTPDGAGDKAGTLKDIGEGGCKLTSHKLADFNSVRISDSVYLITYSAAQVGKCGDVALPSNVWSSSIWVKEGEAWKVIYHMETAVPVAGAKKDDDAKPGDV